MIKLAEQAAAFGMWQWDLVSDRFTLSAGAAVMAGLGAQPMRVSRDELFANVHPDDRATAMTDRGPFGAAVYANEFRTVLPDGSVRWYRNRGHVVSGTNAPQRIIGAVMDITAECQMRTLEDMWTRRGRSFTRTNRGLLADRSDRAFATGEPYSVEFRIVPEPGVIR
jgi:hypothetical protein